MKKTHYITLTPWAIEDEDYQIFETKEDALAYAAQVFAEHQIGSELWTMEIADSDLENDEWCWWDHMSASTLVTWLPMAVTA